MVVPGLMWQGGEQGPPPIGGGVGPIGGVPSGGTSPFQGVRPGSPPAVLPVGGVMCGGGQAPYGSQYDSWVFSE